LVDDVFGVLTYQCFLGLLLCAAIALQVQAGSERGEDPIARLAQQFETDWGRSITDAIRHHEVAGVSVVLVDGAGPMIHGVWGWRDLERRLPTTRDTRYPAASLTKLVAALTLVGADRRGDLDLDRTLEAFARSYPSSTVARWNRQAFIRWQAHWPAQITYRRLLSHAAGLDTHGIGHFGQNAACNAIEGIILGDPDVPGCGGVRPRHPPGTRLRYSGGGYTIAESMLETETGQAFADYATEHVLVPYGLARSTFADAHPSMPLLSHGGSRGYCRSGAMPTLRPKAAAGLLVHPLDLAHLIRLILHDGRDTQHSASYSTATQVIPRRDITQILTPAHHLDSSLHPCRNGCPGRPGVIRYRGKSIPSLRPEFCILGSCREPLRMRPGAPNGEYYGLGVFLSSQTLADGLAARFSHGGDQTGIANLFYARRDTRTALIVFVNGENAWIDDRGMPRGAARLVHEILGSWLRTEGAPGAPDLHSPRGRQARGAQVGPD
jgi:CubicO group peptidase (beta-lactamase class C family)